jgi:hypothetical protein
MEAAAAPPRAIPASAMADSGVSTTAWPSEGRRGLQLRTGTGNAGESLDFEFCSFRLVGHDRPLKFGLGQSDRPKAFDAHEMRGKGGLNNRRNRKWIVAGFRRMHLSGRAKARGLLHRAFEQLRGARGDPQRLPGGAATRLSCARSLDQGDGTHRPLEDAAGQCTAAIHPQQWRRH